MTEETLREPSVSEEPKQAPEQVVEQTPEQPVQPSPEELAALAAQAELEQKVADVKSADIVLLIDAYLKDKAELRDEDDSLNVSEGSIVRWDFKNIPCPSIEELHALIQPVQQKLSQEQTNKEALAFLAATDFYIIRELDNGVACPADIKAQRQAARERIVK